MKESSKSMESTSADSEKEKNKVEGGPDDKDGKPIMITEDSVTGKVYCETPKGSVSSNYSLAKFGRTWTQKKQQKTKSIKRKKTVKERDHPQRGSTKAYEPS